MRTSLVFILLLSSIGCSANRTMLLLQSERFEQGIVDAAEVDAYVARVAAWADKQDDPEKARVDFLYSIMNRPRPVFRDADQVLRWVAPRLLAGDEARRVKILRYLVQKWDHTQNVRIAEFAGFRPTFPHKWTDSQIRTMATVLHERGEARWPYAVRSSLIQDPDSMIRFAVAIDPPTDDIAMEDRLVAPASIAEAIRSPKTRENGILELRKLAASAYWGDRAAANAILHRSYQPNNSSEAQIQSLREMRKKLENDPHPNVPVYTELREMAAKGQTSPPPQR
jgi:hypothetical protein